MILKVLLIHTCYIVLSTICIDSYVLFAANLDDFRSIANKIIPGKLADQLADMAAKNANYRHEFQNGNLKAEYSGSEESDTNGQDKNSKDSGQDESDSESYKAGAPLAIESKVPLKKRYAIRNPYENIDLDELVRRVKEQLVKEYKGTSPVGIDTPDIITTEKSKIIEDYYYKDNQNVDSKGEEYEEVEKISSINPVYFNTERPKYLTPENNGVKIPQQFKESYTKDPKNIYFDKRTTNAAVRYAEAKVTGDNHDMEFIRDNNDYENENAKEGAYDGKFIKDAPEYYEDNAKEPEQNQKETFKDVVKLNAKKVKDTPEYYEDNEKEPEKNPKEEYKDVLKLNKKKVKDAPEYYEDNAKEPIQFNKDNEEQIAKNNENAKDVPEYYEDKDTQGAPLAGNGDVFKEVDMLKSNDSYEDYVTPKRDNVFESVEAPTNAPIKPIHPIKSLISLRPFAADNSNYKQSQPKAISDTITKTKIDGVVSPPIRKITPATVKNLSLIKAKTASMWYKDPNIANYDDVAKQAKVAGNVTKKKRYNTMFPTRFHVKISSPSYFARLPAVGERYNFNEPIPEKDREPENIKHIGNPAAMINKKVKI